MSSTTPTGRRDERSGRSYAAFERAFRAPIAEVWAAVSEPDRLQRWIGTWTGEPETGQVTFFATAEGEDAPAETFRIDACERPRRLAVHSLPSAGNVSSWRVELDLSEEDGVTTLVFAMAMDDPELAASVGPGWDYYLDRLVAAEEGGDVAAIDFADYYPVFADHYRSLFS